MIKQWIDWLTSTHPSTGRFIAEDGERINIADFVRSHPLSIARGLLPGAQPFASYGRRVTVGAEDEGLIWPNGDIVPLPLAGAQLSFQSTSTNDSAAGSNVRTIEIHYLDDLLDQQVEVITLNGITPVLTVATDIRWVQCAHINTYGSIPKAAGTITGTYGGNVYAQIDTGRKRCASSFRMVPRGKVLYIDGAVGSSTSLTADTTTDMSLVASELDNHIYHNPLILIPFAGIGLQNGAIGFTFPPGVRFSEGTLVGGTHTTNKAAIITMSWFGRLENA